MPRPIEMHAHDPRRYLGDMLAWVHQSLASERELLIGLFGDDSSQPLKNETSGNSRISISSDAGPARDILKTSALLDRVFDSICRPVKVGQPEIVLYLSFRPKSWAQDYWLLQILLPVSCTSICSMSAAPRVESAYCR